MANLSDDHIRWVLDLDAKGVQSELTRLSSQSRQFIDDNRRMNAEIKAAEKQMKEAENTMIRLTKAGLSNSDAFKEAEKTYHSVSNEITSYRQRILENSKAIEENNKKHNQAIRTADIQVLTMSQLENRAKSLAGQLKNTSQAAQPETYAALSNELASVRNRMTELDKGSRSMFSVFKGGLAVLTGNLMTKAAEMLKNLVSAGIEWTKAGIEMAKEAEGVVSAFNKLDNAKKNLQDMRKATRNTIADLSLMQKAVRANEMGIGIEKMSSLLQFAQIQAKKMGQDVDYMANSIVDGLGRKSTMVLDNLGISASRVQEEVKKTGDFTAAVLNIVNDTLKKQGDEALTGAEKAAQASAKWENAQLKVGQRMQWLAGVWDNVSSGIADGISSMAGETRTANEVFDDQMDKVAKLNVETLPLIDRYEQMSKKIKLNYDQTKDLNPEQEELLAVIDQIRQAIPGVVTEFDKYGRALGINADKARDFIRTQVAMLKYMNQDAISEIEKQIDEYTNKIETLKKAKETGGYYTYTGGSNVSGGTKIFQSYSFEEMGEIENDLSKAEVLRTGALARLNQINGQSLEDQVKANENRIANQNKFNSMNKKELDDWIKDEKNASDQYLGIAKDTYTKRFASNDLPGGSASKAGKKRTDERKGLNDMLEVLEIKHNQKLAKINQDYLNGTINSTAELNRKLHAQEQAFYTLREASLKNYRDKASQGELKDEAEKLIAQQQNERLTKETAFRQKLEKIIIEADPSMKEIERYKEALSAYELYGETRESISLRIAAAETEAQKKAMEQKYRAFVILEKEHRDNLKAINDSLHARENAEAEKNFENDFKTRRQEMQSELDELILKASGLSGSQAFEAEMAVHIQRLKMINEEIEARGQAGLVAEEGMDKLLKRQSKTEMDMTNLTRKELEKRTAQFQQYGNTVGQALANVMTGQQDALKAFGDATTDIVFDVLSQIIEAELIKVMASSTSSIMRATAEAMSTPQSALTFGASGFATAAILTGAITAATVVAKSALKGLLGKKKGSSSDDSSRAGSSSGSISVKQNGFARGGLHEGYTGEGGKYDIKGYFPDGQPYHAGEYIIPKEVLKIPWVGTMVGQIEAQRVKRRGGIPRVPGFADGGFHGAASDQKQAEGAWMWRLVEVMENLNKKEFKTILGVTEYQAALDDASEKNKHFKRKNTWA